MDPSTGATRGSRTQAARWQVPSSDTLARRGIPALTAIAPSIAARWAEGIWFRVPSRSPKPDDRAFLRTGEPTSMMIDGDKIVAWRWGQGPAVILVHGWGGYAGDMGAFVEPLVKHGYRVILFDAPGHGESGGRRSATRRGLLDAVSILGAYQRELGEIEGVVAHSGGATLIAAAMREGLRVRRLALVAPLDDFRAYAERFCHELGLNESATRLWMTRVEQRVKTPWADLAVSATPGAAEVPPVLVVHDRRDSQVPFDHALEIARTWPIAWLRPVDGLGHRRLLKDPEVVRSITSFIAGDDEGSFQQWRVK